MIKCLDGPAEISTDFSIFAFRLLEEQTNGEVRKEDFYTVPSAYSVTNFVEALTKKAEYDLSPHFACGMGTYIFNSGGRMVGLNM